MSYTLVVASMLNKKRGGTGCLASDETPASQTADILAVLGGEGGLTARELDVLRLLAKGRSAPFIADSLGISGSTVKGHVRHIYEKLGVANKQELLSLLESRGASG